MDLLKATLKEQFDKSEELKRRILLNFEQLN